MTAPFRRDRLAEWITALPSALVGLGSFLTLFILFSRADPVIWGAEGAGNLWRFLSSVSEHGGREGGIGPMIVATLAVLALALALAVPVGVLVAIALAEWVPGNSAVGRAASIALDMTAALPSVVVGLFGLTFFCEILGLGWSLLSGGLTLATMILPLFVRVAQAGLLAVPARFRLAGAALGLPPGVVILRIVVPAAIPALAAGLLLAAGRVLAESAALLFTAGGSAKMPGSVFDSGRVLALHIFHLIMEVPGGEGRACATAIVLVGISALSGVAARRLPAWFAASATGGSIAG